MTDFQTKCIDACQRFSQVMRLELGFQEVFGKRNLFGRRERMFVGKVLRGAHSVEIFVYVDEAGFMVDDKRWFICERSDFDSDEQLINGFLGKLQMYFNEDKPDKRAE